MTAASTTYGPTRLWCRRCHASAWNETDLARDCECKEGGEFAPMPSPRGESILSLGYSRLLVEQARKSPQGVAREETTVRGAKPFRLMFRRCYRTRDAEGRPEWSGGAVVEVSDPTRYTYCPSPRQMRRVFRLREGWNVTTVSRALHRGLFTLDTLRTLHEQREALFRKVQPLPQAAKDRLAQAGEAAGRPIDYASMTDADVRWYEQQIGGER